MTLDSYIKEVGDPIGTLCLKYKDEYENPCRGSHPGKQKQPGGLGLHTVQVIEKALELNQVFNRKEIIEVCLVHDLRHWKAFPLNEAQMLAIRATKGTPYEVWRPTPHFRFVVLILIADMWSAFINEKDL